MTELFVFILIISGMLLGTLVVFLACFLIWIIAKNLFPNSNFTEYLDVIFEDPEDTHRIKISKIKPWIIKDAK